MTDAERIAELEGILDGMRSILDVVRQEWMAQGTWSDYDEAVHARGVSYNLRKREIAND